MKTDFNDDFRPLSDFAKPGTGSYRRTYKRAKKYNALVLIGDIPYILMSRYSNGQLEDNKPKDEAGKIEFHLQKYQKFSTVGKMNQIIRKIQEGLARKDLKLEKLYDQLDEEKDDDAREGIDNDIEILANSHRESELKLEAATKRKSEIKSSQKATIGKVQNRLKKKSDGKTEASSK